MLPIYRLQLRPTSAGTCEQSLPAQPIACRPIFVDPKFADGLGGTSWLKPSFAPTAVRLAVLRARWLLLFRLEGVELFRGCSSSFLDSLSVQMRESFFSKGDIVFRQSEVASELFVVVTGHCDRLIEVILGLGASSPLSSLSPGRS